MMQESECNFGVFCGLEGIEKPDTTIYEIALERIGNIAPEEALHIGDSMLKDYGRPINCLIWSAVDECLKMV
ncbi:haloacid dehalogenase-like hydrolase domain-containing protein 3-like [Trifolium medium]|uniref:Haloacid dehalogenase-like hydrolase domain-containing protein 3-like n=1 Tax=Trifolium medium TaxID=97028 RepID=A0A392RU96_9FABA|nr:haloacid dehalogenase-like hydrolase domain-containing protein 3-like [Trifolium medium]